ncbi:MAG: AAA family ATPase, partial [Desulfobacterales bacterium]
MYLSFYDLRRKPFEITVDPDFLWLGEKHKEALATLEYGIREDKGFLLLTGDVGTGKTVLINRLVRNIRLQSIISTVPDPGLDLIDFYNFLAATFKFGRTVKSKGEFLALLKKFLIKAEAIKRKVLLLIDEAQRLNHNLLEEIRLLSNIEMENRKLINIFFVGQSEFNQILLEPRNRAVRQRIAVRYQIEPLSVEETAQYVLHRLQVAGAEHSIFTADALREIFVFTSGNPRLTNIICDHALLTGYSMEREAIDSGVIRECAEELQLPGE